MPGIGARDLQEGAEIVEGRRESGLAGPRQPYSSQPNGAPAGHDGNQVWARPGPIT